MPQIIVLNRYIGPGKRIYNERIDFMKIIIDGKLYDTETADLVAVGTFVEVYRTKKGNWFKKSDSIFGQGCQIIPIDQSEAKKLVGLHTPDRYNKYFGQAEMA